eukprot:4246944-Pleurochrysis_carterae.AAC.3
MIAQTKLSALLALAVKPSLPPILEDKDKGDDGRRRSVARKPTNVDLTTKDHAPHLPKKRDDGLLPGGILLGIDVGWRVRKGLPDPPKNEPEKVKWAVDQLLRKYKNRGYKLYKKPAGAKKQARAKGAAASARRSGGNDLTRTKFVRVEKTDGEESYEKEDTADDTTRAARASSRTLIGRQQLTLGRQREPLGAAAAP